MRSFWVYGPLIALDILVGVLMILVITTTELPPPAPNVSCLRILSAVAIYGEEVVVAWALKNGYTVAQIAALREKCRKI